MQAGVVPIDKVGTALYLKAKQLIPAGTGLLSKRPEMFLPDQVRRECPEVESIQPATASKRNPESDYWLTGSARQPL